ncbi:MAG: DUF1826 domain-containing protein [Roseobacter sp.]
MTLHREIIKDAAIGVGFATTPKGLSSIEHPGCAAAIWQRQPSDRFQAWIDGLRPETLPKARITLRPDMVRAAMINLVEASGIQDCDERTMLADDVAAMGLIFANVLRVPYLRLRLETVSTNACQKFHVDTVTARLICTYRGSGTQYGISTDGAEPGSIYNIPTGSPVILRGTLWPNAPRTGLFHRSPPIEGTGETRLVLVLDPISALEGGSDEHFIH